MVTPVVFGYLLSAGPRHFICRPLDTAKLSSFVHVGDSMLPCTSSWQAVFACLPLRRAQCLLCRPMVIARPSSFVPKGDSGVRAMLVVEHTARPLLNWMVSRLVDTVRGDKLFLARANAKASAAQVRHIFFSCS